ncbi:uncharacterized protein LOC109863117, partial [Pseudomyrmex gracilis]|uniref:uncharacterized protein LOC109863117 n=1 Tax=Pseudomyrmex gracilis TaxID=219809 RepID=UPI000995682F
MAKLLRSQEMINVKDRYFSLNRILLQTVGLWPYQDSKLDRLQLCFIYIILITSIIFQLKYLMGELQCICQNLKSNELMIVDKYGEIGRRCTAKLSVFFVSGAVIGVASQVYSTILYINSSTNISFQDKYKELFITEYFIVQEQYYYFTLLHIIGALSIGTVAFIATGTMLIAYLYHACGMFKIASFRIEHAMNIDKYQNVSLIYKNLIYTNIVLAVDIHRKAMMFSTYLISTFETTFFFLILFGVLTLSLNMFRCFQLASSKCHIDDFVLYCVITIIAFAYMFWANFIGQEITDHYNDVFVTV